MSVIIKNPNRHVWEGWTVQDFIKDLHMQFDAFKYSFKSKDAVKSWCKDNQPYYKKHIPEVADYFCKSWEAWKNNL